MRNLELATKTALALYGKFISFLRPFLDLINLLIQLRKIRRKRERSWEPQQKCVCSTTSSVSTNGPIPQLENTLSEKLLTGLDGMAEDTVLRKECSKNIIEYYLARCTLVSLPRAQADSSLMAITGG